jgi:hypothetical protein
VKSADAAPQPQPPKPTPSSSAETAVSAPPSRVLSFVGWGLVAAGAAAGAAGAVLLLDAKAKNAAVHSLPAGTMWSTDEARGDFTAAKTEQTIGLACLVAAPILAVGGAALLWARGAHTDLVVTPKSAYAAVRLEL